MPACYAFAVLWIGVSIIRYVEVVGRMLDRLLPVRETWALTWDSYYPFLAKFARIGPDLAISVVLVIGAYGLRRHRRWGPGVCYFWLATVIPLAILDAIHAGAGMVYLVSPGAHSDVAGLSIAFLRGLIGGGFPIFLALWLSQRHVRHRMASWGR